MFPDSKKKFEPTEETFNNTSISVGDDQGVAGGVQVGDVHVHLLVLDSGDRVDLGHEEDQVALVNIVAQDVDDEEQVRPVLGWSCDQGGSFGFFLLFFFLGLLFLFWLFLLSITILDSCVTILNSCIIAINFSFQGFRFLFNFLGFFLFGSRNSRNKLSLNAKLLMKSIPFL